MRALILIGTACLALAACDGPAPDQNASNEAIVTETVPDDGNWTDVNTDQAAQGNVGDCEKASKCPREAPGVE